MLTELGYDIYSATGAGPFDVNAFCNASDVVNWIASPAQSGSVA